MANENTVTRKDALTAAINMFEPNDETRVVLEKMLSQITKSEDYVSPSQEKAKAERAALMEACIEAIAANPDVDVDTKWLMNHVNGVNSTQKASNLMATAAKQGRIEKVYGSNKKVHYKVA